MVDGAEVVKGPTMSHTSNAIASNLTTPTVQHMNAHAGARWAASRGLRVLRVEPNGKTPYRSGVNEATTDAATIDKWFAEEPGLNYGIATGHGLVALDCDAKHASFHADYFSLAAPRTLEFGSANGGYRILLRRLQGGRRDFAPSINVRGKGGYIVGPGSVINGKRYRIEVDAPIAPAPAEITARLSRHTDKPTAADTSTPLGEMDTAPALTRAWGIVAGHAGVDEGGRDNECFRVACRVKDEGVSDGTCLEVMRQFNAEKCNPPLPEADIERVVSSAYSNGQRPPGAANPAVEFEDLTDLLIELGLRQARPKPSPTIKATPFAWVMPSAIEPRDWLYGRHLIRKFLSATVAPGGLGKSSLVLVEALSIATGRALLVDKAPPEGKVWYWNGEDPYDELQRRVMAACTHYGIAQTRLRAGYLSTAVASPRL